jgi:hypothetical protein
MSEARNRIVQVRRFSGSDGLEMVHAPLPTAGRGEVRVRVLASGVEYTDVVLVDRQRISIARRPAHGRPQCGRSKSAGFLPINQRRRPGGPIAGLNACCGTLTAFPSFGALDLGCHPI